MGIASGFALQMARNRQNKQTNGALAAFASKLLITQTTQPINPATSLVIEFSIQRMHRQFVSVKWNFIRFRVVSFNLIALCAWRWVSAILILVGLFASSATFWVQLMNGIWQRSIRRQSRRWPIDIPQNVSLFHDTCSHANWTLVEITRNDAEFGKFRFYRVEPPENSAHNSYSSVSICNWPSTKSNGNIDWHLQAFLVKKEHSKDAQKDQFKFYAEKSRIPTTICFCQIQTISISRYFDHLFFVREPAVLIAVSLFGFHLPLGLVSGNISRENSLS